MSGLPDTGTRTTFAAGGAQREADPDKPPVELISPTLYVRVAMHMAKADKKYRDIGGARNYEKGMSVMRCVGAIVRHALAYMMRKTDEDHLAAVAWNAMALMHYEAFGGVQDGQRYATFKQLDDRPNWRVAPSDDEVVTQADAFLRSQVGAS